MSVFGFINKSKPVITPEDRAWVEDNFKWLIETFGYPAPEQEQKTISPQYFPKTFSSNTITIDHVVADLCALLNVPENKIAVEIHTDIRDSQNAPYESVGAPNTRVEVTKTGYRIHVFNYLLSRPERLVIELLYEFIAIRLTESRVNWGTGKEAELFIYLAAVYFNFGLILAQHLADIGRKTDGLWEHKWSNLSQMPPQVMAFALALQSKLTAQHNPAWITELSGSIKSDLKNAMSLLESNPSPLVDKSEIEAALMFEKSNEQYYSNDFRAAIDTLESVIKLTEDKKLKSVALNNIGYYLQRLKEYEKSIPYFEQAIAIDHEFGYAHDNLGYSLIKCGRLEEGKESIARALNITNNEPSFSYRNMALYYWAKGDRAEAEKNFQIAFETETEELPVDLLELHYAEFLLDQGETEKAMQFLRAAVEKGEPEAIAKMKELTR